MAYAVRIKDHPELLEMFGKPYTACLLRYGRSRMTEAVLFAFDLLELGGKDLRGSTLETRKRELAKLLRKAAWTLQLNEHIDEPGISSSGMPANSASRASYRSG
jgi:hypothetical protein